MGTTLYIVRQASIDTKVTHQSGHNELAFSRFDHHMLGRILAFW